MPIKSAICIYLARVAGFEPAHDGIRIHCLTAWRYPIIRFTLLKKLGWIVGFEPTHTGATTLCLNRLTIPTTLVPFLKKLATGIGFEPTTSSVTGWHSNQLNYLAKLYDCFGGRYRARTYDPLLVRQVLSQLS